MKLTALLIGTLFVIATCHTSFLEQADWIFNKDDGNKEDIVNFFEGVFSYFNLSSPTQISNCFVDTSAAVYFRLLKKIGDILQDTKERNSVRLHLEFVKVGLMFKSLEDTHGCIFMSSDFTDLLTALKVDEQHPKELKTILYLYYQAHYSDLFEGYKPILDSLNTQSHLAAGEAFGALLEDTVSTIKKEGLNYISFIGFANGGAISLDISDPDDSLKCYDDESSGLILEFIYETASAVASGTFKEAPLNAFKFMKSEGKDLLEKIPKEDVQCEASSQDNQELSNKLGIDVMTEEFGDLFIRYINNNRLHYYMFCKSLKKAFDRRNLHHAGSLYYQFLKDVASSKK